ncbi:hypothetical protein [Streptomyces sp. NPDC005017]|uniref:hypothetical protein n=1 Tax=Streptomyces sp. NPDC005017 TaxID=3364706 RepID=UPI00368A2A7A
MIPALNQLVDLVEEHLAEEPDIQRLTGALGTIEYHLRRMFSSLAGMPLSEYVRRRRMTAPAGPVRAGPEPRPTDRCGLVLSRACRAGAGWS